MAQDRKVADSVPGKQLPNAGKGDRQAASMLRRGNAGREAQGGQGARAAAPAAPVTPHISGTVQEWKAMDPAKGKHLSNADKQSLRNKVAQATVDTTVGLLRQQWDAQPSGGHQTVWAGIKIRNAQGNTEALLVRIDAHGHYSVAKVDNVRKQEAVDEAVDNITPELQAKLAADPGHAEREAVQAAGSTYLVSLSAAGTVTVEKTGNIRDTTAIDDALDALAQEMAKTPLGQRHKLSETLNVAGGHKWHVSLTAEGKADVSKQGGFWGSLMHVLDQVVMPIIDVASIFVPVLVPVAIGLAAIKSAEDIAHGDLLGGILGMAGAVAGGVGVLAKAGALGTVAEEAANAGTVTGIAREANIARQAVEGTQAAVGAGREMADGDFLGGILGLAGAAAGSVGGIAKDVGAGTIASNAGTLNRVVAGAQGARGVALAAEHGDALSALTAANGAVGRGVFAGKGESSNSKVEMGSAFADVALAATSGDWRSALETAGTAASSAGPLKGFTVGPTASSFWLGVPPPTAVTNAAVHDPASINDADAAEVLKRAQQQASAQQQSELTVGPNAATALQPIASEILQLIPMVPIVPLSLSAGIHETDTEESTQQRDDQQQVLRANNQVYGTPTTETNMSAASEQLTNQNQSAMLKQNDQDPNFFTNQLISRVFETDPATMALQLLTQTMEMGFATDSDKGSVYGQGRQALDRPLLDISHASTHPEQQQVGNWTRVTDQDLQKMAINPSILQNNKTGFQAGIYMDGCGHYVVGFADTHPTSIKDWWTDIEQGPLHNIFGVPGQYKDAVNVAREAKLVFGPNLVAFTGDSLGGGLAAIASAATKTPAIIFNPAGLSDSTYTGLGIPITEKQAAKDGRVRQYVVNGEILSTVQGKPILGLLAPGAPGYQIKLSDPKPLAWWQHLVGLDLKHMVQLHRYPSLAAAMDSAPASR